MNNRQTIDVVWFKRDLRLSDHVPLKHAIESPRPVLLLYIFEPSLFESDHYGNRHGRFVWESLCDMRDQLEPYDADIVTVYDEVIPFFEKLSKIYNIHTAYSHEETGINLTFERDKDFARFCDRYGIRWEESPTNAVFRGLMHRDGWRDRWKERAKRELHAPDLTALNAIGISSDQWNEFKLKPIPQSFKTPNLLFQQGGEANAWRCLEDFVYERGRRYNDLISKPAGSRYGCSRLSPFLTWGNLSLQQAYQFLWDQYEELDHQWPLRSFGSRLKWHCHFIQKFEAEPRIEFENLNRGYNDIRTERNEEFIEAWEAGETGFPLVDACMRAVKQTGYINFRMRAMLVSVLTHHLWQPWQAGAQFLGRQFLDFEPGIHYSQFQMQAGTMGVNSVRIYNPVKQGYDHDADGNFIRQWVPELRPVPVELIHEPWQMSPMEQQMYGVKLGSEYPERLVDHKVAYNKANETLWSKKNDPKVKRENERILQKHVKTRS
ncbi:deoxyribodipyrimidine photo-lyase family protein (cryptochrome) [Fodinibius salinus]|uniref:Deoxyribodipyrimidine photo-lyase family protein (Cryptochrome) n=1 Tax=Fodinibius salinus TaxID=860790 RepID=A0A5D3YJT5_9BACT|nr:deoxyribodipyrimidine photo-lyase [Fodinibius salinus]TYP94043.1 deoxyribodipyrimidine photo-lyase family protein (cryptochrome) [Fodinibius salinus]